MLSHGRGAKNCEQEVQTYGAQHESFRTAQELRNHWIDRSMLSEHCETIIQCTNAFCGTIGLFTRKLFWNE